MKRIGMHFWIQARLLVLESIVCLLNSVNALSQNAVVGTGFGTGWGGSCGNNSDFIYFMPGAGTSYTSGILSPNNTGNQYWRIGMDWGGTVKQLHTNNTGTDEIIPPNATYTLDPSCVTSGAMYLDVASTAYHYIFKTKDAGSNPTNQFVAFEVQGLVRSVTSVTQNPVSSSVTSGQPVTITANLSGALATGQAVYLRYSYSSNFITSAVVSMSGSGTMYSGIIPAGINTSGASVYYYVFTSGDANVLPDGSNADFYTINLYNNSGNNFTYTVLTTAIIYQHNFNDNSTSSTNSNPYTTHPTLTSPIGILHSNLSGSTWASSSAFIGANGNSNTGCLAVLNTTNSIILTFAVGQGYSFSVSSFSFWTRTSNSATWSMSINGISAGSGTASVAGANTGILPVANLIADLYGTITVVITPGGPGSFRMDDFILTGNVIPSTSYNPVTGFSASNLCFNNTDVTWITPVKYNTSNNTIIVFAKEGSAIIAGTPLSNVSSYSASASFGSGTTFENDAAAFCVYKGDGTSISLANFSPGTTYYLLAYNVLDPNTYSTAVTTSFSTLTVSSNISLPGVSPGNGQILVSWTNPASCFDEVMIIATDNGTVSTVPAGDGSLYTSNPVYNDGTNSGNLSNNEFCIYRGTSTSVTMTGLVNGTTYNLKIFVRKGTTWSSGISLSGIPITVFSGDFRSKQNGNWTSVNTWEQYSGGVWVAATTFPNSTSSDVTIQPGNIITVDGPGPYALKNLTVSATAKLYSNNTSTATNIYLSVFGNIQCNGTVGNAPSNDNLAFNIEGTSGIISGTGTYTTSRIRKYYNANPVTALSIDMNVTTQWNASAAIYNGNANTTSFNMTINAGKTVTVSNGGNVSIHGPSGSGFNNSHGTYTINGTLTITGSLILVNSNNNVLYPSTFNIGSSGVVNVSQINAGASGVSGSKFLIAGGGLLNIMGTGSFTAFSTTNNTYTINTASTIQYSAGGAQTVEALLSYGNLSISGTGIKSANNNVTISNNFLLSAATYSQAGFKTTLSGGGTLTGNGGDFAAGSAGGTIYFAGSGNINGTTPMNFNNLTLNSGTVSVSISGCTAKNLDMMGGIFNIGLANQFNIASGGSVNAAAGDFSPGPSGGILNFNGSGIFSGNCNPYHVFISGGVNFGSGTVTIQNGGSLRINNGGYADTNGPFYSSGSTLIYNPGGIYNRSIEWGQVIALEAGYPHHVIVQNGTTLNLGTYTPANLEIGGDLTIGTSTSGNNKVNMNALVQPLKILGNLFIGDNLTSGNELLLSSAPGGDLELWGNFTRYTANNYFTYGNRSVFFKGNTNAGINATIQKFYRIAIQKTGSGSLTLNSPVIIENNADFTTGIIHSSSTNLFTFEQAATVTGSPSSASFINGPATKQYNNAGSEFTFPLGKAGSIPVYNPCGIAPVNIGGFTTFTAEYFMDPLEQQTLMGQFLLGIIKPGYWNISNSNSSSVARVSLYYTNPGPGQWVYYDGTATSAPFYSTMTDPCETCNVGVVHREGAINSWVLTSNSGNFNALIPEYRHYTDNGFIYTTPVSGFSSFSLGYSYHVILKLPVKLLSFTGQFSGSNGLLEWKVENTRELAGFDLQYSRDGRTFTKLASIYPSGAPEYNFIHRNLAPGNHYYRLVIKDKKGTTFHGPVILLTTGKQKTKIQGLLNNPVNDMLIPVILSASGQKAIAIITDVSGKVMFREEIQLIQGHNHWKISIASIISPGIYFISIETSDGIRATLKFARQ